MSLKKLLAKLQKYKHPDLLPPDEVVAFGLTFKSKKDYKSQSAPHLVTMVEYVTRFEEEGDFYIVDLTFFYKGDAQMLSQISLFTRFNAEKYNKGGDGPNVDLWTRGYDEETDRIDARFKSFKRQIRHDFLNQQINFNTLQTFLET